MSEDTVSAMDEISGQLVDNEKPTGDDKHSIPQTQNKQTLYSGIVELVVPAPLVLKMVLKLYELLQTISELSVLSTRGAVTRGMFFTIVLGKPMPLIDVLASKLPAVRIMPERPNAGRYEDSSYPQVGDKKAVTNRIVLTPRET